MREMTEEDFRQLIELGRESRRIEHKPPFSWIDDEAKWLRDKVTQTILGMANSRGGDIIIGIEEKTGSFSGLTEEQVDSFDDFDAVKGVVDGFASPSVNFDIAEAQFYDEKFVVIRVSEFEELPIICRKDSEKFPQLLRRGDVYVRARSGPPATTRVTETEMREILEVAIDKGSGKLDVRARKWLEEGSDEMFAQQKEQFDS